MKKHTLLVYSLAALLCAAFSGIFCSGAAASELVFQGQNAGIFPGANPSDTADLMSSVYHPAASTASIPNVSPSTLIEQSVESQISSQIFNDIFNSAAASGNFDLGGGSNISFVRAGGEITITLIDPVNGTTTITVPDI